MNRTEFEQTLNELYADLESKNGVFRTFFDVSESELEDLKKYAAVSLLATDRYYSNLTRLRMERKEL